MPLAGFLPKVVSTVEIQILLPKSIQEAHRDHWHHTWANLGQNFQITKTAVTPRLLVAVTWNLAKVAHTRHAPSCKISAPYPQWFKSYHQKGSFLTSFKTLVSIPFKTPNICKIQHCSYIYKISFQDPTRCHCNHHFCPKCKVRSFQDPWFSLFPGSWQVDSLFFSPQSATGMQRTSNWHLMSGRVRSH